MTSSETSLSSTSIQQWINEKFDVQRIQAELQANGHDADTIAAHLKEFKKAKYAKRQAIGFVCLVSGAFMGFLSCVLTLWNPVPALYNVVLYGFTTVAILTICLGMYAIFE